MDIRVEISLKGCFALIFMQVCLDCIPQVYMLRGVKDHHSFDEFDISAILNFMSRCKHFQTFTDGQCINKVKLLNDSSHMHSFFIFFILLFVSQPLYAQTNLIKMSNGMFIFLFLFIMKVISVRNKVMHSPDFRLSKKEMEDSIKIVQELAKILEKRAPGLKNISKEIQQVSTQQQLLHIMVQ